MQVSFATSPGHPDRANEDHVIATPQAVILLDGAGGPSELANGCQHGVAWLVRHLGSNLAAHLAEAPEVALSLALGRSIEHVAGLHRDTCDLGHPGTPSTTVAIIREGADTLDYLVLADSTIAVENEHGDVTAVTDKRIDRIAAEAKAAMAKHATGTPEHQRYRVESVREQQLHRNTSGGFWVAAADPEAADHAYMGSLPLARVNRAVVLSDGATRAITWGLLDWPAVLKLASEHGPEAPISLVRDAEASDPRGSRWPRTKHADDATLAIANVGRFATPR